MLSTLTFLALAASAFAAPNYTPPGNRPAGYTPSSHTQSIDTTVDLGYTKYLGTNNGNGVTQWLGMRYAAAPLGDLRFRAPQSPPVNKTLQIADKVRTLTTFIYHEFTNKHTARRSVS